MNSYNLSKKLAMIDAIIRAQENAKDIGGETLEPSTYNLSSEISADSIPANSSLPLDYFEKVTLPSVMSTYKNADQFSEKADMGLQDLLWNKDEPWVKKPAVKDPKSSGKYIDVDGVIRKKRIQEILNNIHPRVV
jgi:hypothetical protein